MAKEPASELIMPAAKMKPILAASKTAPDDEPPAPGEPPLKPGVPAAIGLTTDGEGLIIMHRNKKMKPKKLLSMLKAEAGKAKIALNTGSLRFGRAMVDPEYDGGMIRFFVNKDTPGTMRPKLVEVAKRIPYQKVEINVDMTLEDEPEDDEAAPSGVSAAAPEVAPVPAAPPEPPPPPPLDIRTLTSELAGLIRQIASASGMDAEFKKKLIAAANAGNDAIKAGNAAAAAQVIGVLRKSIQPPDDGVRSAPALRVWTDAKDAVDGQLNQLYALLRRSGIPALGEIAGEIENVLEEFRVALTASLMDFDKATGPARETARGKALSTVTDYRNRLRSDKHVIAADANPFSVTVTAQATLGGALDQLSRQLAA